MKTHSRALERAKQFFLNKRFHGLVVFEFAGIVRGARHWICQCDCGAVKSVNGSYLKNGYVQSCGCRQKTANQLPQGQAAQNRLFDQYKNNARYRKIKFELSKEELLELCVKPCAYCGSGPNSSMKKRITNLHGDFTYTGIDRVDSAKGYEIKNCVPCCNICNKMKLDWSATEFLEHVKKIAQYHK